MRFRKMHGLGNDYVYVSCFDQEIGDPVEVARKVSDRHFGVGGDGMILVMPSEIADVRMRMFNADGSEGEMCGNGVRCVAKFAYDHDLARVNPMAVETLAGIKTIDLTLDADGKVASASVDMGEPILDPPAIPMIATGSASPNQAVNVPISVCGESFEMTGVSMGNPHVTIYIDDVDSVDLEGIGPVIETDARFPQRVNVHFVEVISDVEVKMRTWERGSGVTLACGTGASAVCVAGVLTGRSGRKITAHLPGGDLMLEWRQDTNHVFMTGPATEVFSGEWAE